MAENQKHLICEWIVKGFCDVDKEDCLHARPHTYRPALIYFDNCDFSKCDNAGAMVKCCPIEKEVGND